MTNDFVSVQSFLEARYSRPQWYDSTVGRFLSEDPVGFASGDANLYRYVGNSPTNATDPFGLAANWHHLLPNQFDAQFGAAGITTEMRHASAYGWVIDSAYHAKLHPQWNKAWRDFFKSAPGNVGAREVLDQLAVMRAQFANLLEHGSQATMSYSEWGSHLAKLRYAAQKAAAGGKVAVQITRGVGKSLKVIGIITFAYNAANGGVVVAAEQGTEDALWPFLDIARQAANPASDLYREWIKGGSLNRRRQEHYWQQILRDENRSGPLRIRP